MDYLTILSTTRLILFPVPSSLPTPSAASSSPSGSLDLLLLDNSSPLSSPSTPTNPLSDLESTSLMPAPVSMPLGSILYSDTHTAYFLIHHIMTSSMNHIAHNHHHHDNDDETLRHTCAGGGWGASHNPGGCGGMSRQLMIEAEVMAWKEIDRAKLFARAVGRVFQGFGEGRKMRDGELKELAARFGLGVHDVSAGDGGEDVEGAKGDREGGAVTSEGGHEKGGLLFA
ncbi:hypothetical protein IAU59_003576 [Kwoniella sp. CBS 9459]